MECLICKVGNTHPGAKTLTFELGERIVILKHVAGEVCDTCGHLYTDSETSKRVLAEVKQRFASVWSGVGDGKDVVHRKSTLRTRLAHMLALVRAKSKTASLHVQTGGCF